MTQKENIKAGIEGQINWYDGKSVNRKQYYRFFRVVEVLLASSKPF
jgi:hypothetical protein